MRALLASSILLAACSGPDGLELRTHVADWRDQIVYQIVVDRFEDGDLTNDEVDGIATDPSDLARFQGGDWRGVIDRLDYLEELGVTALWISPPYRNVQRTEEEDGYHGYWPADFTEANPRFGSIEDLRELVSSAHERGMLVILDVVPNHAGRVFSYDLDGDGTIGEGEIEPAYSVDGPYEVPLVFTEAPRAHLGNEIIALGPSHFHRRGDGDLADPIQRELGDFPTGLRDLDTENPETVAALVDTHVRWVLETDVDGFRIDAVPHAAREFWEAFCQGVRDELAEHGKDRFLLLGEVFSSSPETLASYTELYGLDAAFAFDFKFDLIDGVLLEGRPPAIARGALRDHRELFAASGQPNGIGISPWQARVAFADNHDVWRLRGELDDPLAAQIALTIVMTSDGIPSIYYGTEQELRGGDHHRSREPLFRESFDATNATYRHLARLIQLRRASIALRRGTLEIRYLSQSGGADAVPAADAGMIAYERIDPSERILVVVNSSIQTSRARFSTGFEEGARLYDALGGSDAPWIVGQTRTLDIHLPGRSSVVLERR